MRKMYFTDDSGDYIIIGTAREIKSLENSCQNADKGIRPFCAPAQYNMNKIYGFSVTYQVGDRIPWFTIMNEHTIAGLVLDGYLK